jgi:hypothetical protein
LPLKIMTLFILTRVGMIDECHIDMFSNRHEHRRGNMGKQRKISQPLLIRELRFVIKVGSSNFITIFDSAPRHQIGFMGTHAFHISSL